MILESYESRLYREGLRCFLVQNVKDTAQWLVAQHAQNRSIVHGLRSLVYLTGQLEAT